MYIGSIAAHRVRAVEGEGPGAERPGALAAGRRLLRRPVLAVLRAGLACALTETRQVCDGVAPCLAVQTGASSSC